jgi:hypothetical protein
MRAGNLLTAAVLAVMLSHASASDAQAPLQLPTAHIGNGGGASASPSFRLQASLPSVAAITSARSTGYSLCVGFQCLSNAANRRIMLPLTQQLVILERDPNGDFNSAQPLLLPSITRGTLTDARDVFVITLTQTSTVSIALDGVSAPLDSRVQLQAWIATRQQATHFTTDVPHKLGPLMMPAGAHYIIVFSEDLSGKTYSLVVSPSR